MNADAFDPREPLLVVGAHAFDAEVMAGALTAEWSRRGGQAMLVHISLGERGHHSKTAAQYAEQKKQEAHSAARLLGAEVIILGREDTRSAGVGDDVANELAGIVRSLRPGTVVTHWRGSWHPDHAAAHYATVKGLLLAGLKAAGDPDVMPHTPRSLLFAENWEDGEGHRPDVYLDVTSSYDTWINALNAYEIGRIPAPGFPYQDYYSSLARVRGCVIGVQYAEAFQSASVETMSGLGLGIRDRWPQ